MLWRKHHGPGKSAGLWNPAAGRYIREPAQLISIPLPPLRAFPGPYRNSSTMDLTLFAAEAIALNRQLSQHEENELAEEQAALAGGLCSMKLSPPSKSRLARRRAQAQAGRSGAANPCSTSAGL